MRRRRNEELALEGVVVVVVVAWCVVGVGVDNAEEYRDWEEAAVVRGPPNRPMMMGLVVVAVVVVVRGGVSGCGVGAFPAPSLRFPATKTTRAELRGAAPLSFSVLQEEEGPELASGWWPGVVLVSAEAEMRDGGVEPWAWAS